MGIPVFLRQERGGLLAVPIRWSDSGLGIGAQTVTQKYMASNDQGIDKFVVFNYRCVYGY